MKFIDYMTLGVVVICVFLGLMLFAGKPENVTTVTVVDSQGQATQEAAPALEKTDEYGNKMCWEPYSHQYTFGACQP